MRLVQILVPVIIVGKYFITSMRALADVGALSMVMHVVTDLIFALSNVHPRAVMPLCVAVRLHMLAFSLVAHCSYR